MEFAISVLIETLSTNLISVYKDVNELQGLLTILGIVIGFFSITQGAKRCHDRDNSGW